MAKSERASAATASPRRAAARSTEVAATDPAEKSVTTRGEGDLTPVVGRNLRRFRSERGLSLEALSKLSGVSRAMLNQVELGHSTPTINVVWKIARALDMPFSALISQEPHQGTWILPRAKSRVLTSQDGSFTSRALFPMDRPRLVEFYELRLAPGGRELAEAHPAGTTENLVVARGRLALSVDGDRRLLDEGDAIFFEADVPHAYENIDQAGEAVLYLVMTYPRKSEGQLGG
ncbi:MAG: XRE family transcriptional regulator [Polyangiaceae bacterium]